MYECVYVFVLYCIIVLCYRYITVLHDVRRLERIRICAIQIPLWSVALISESVKNTSESCFRGERNNDCFKPVWD